MTTTASDARTEAKPACLVMGCWFMESLPDPREAVRFADGQPGDLPVWNAQEFKEAVQRRARRLRLLLSSENLRGSDCLTTAAATPAAAVARQRPAFFALGGAGTGRVADAMAAAASLDDYQLIRYSEDTCGLSAFVDPRQLALTEPPKALLLSPVSTDVNAVRFGVQTPAGDALTIIVLHWPAATYASTSSREAADLLTAERLSSELRSEVQLQRDEYLQQTDLTEIDNAWNRNVVLMGRFRHPPWHPLLYETLQSRYSVRAMQQTPCDSPRKPSSWKAYSTCPIPMFNLSYAFVAEPDASSAALPNLSRPDSEPVGLTDHILLSRSLLLGKTGWQYHPTPGDDETVSVRQVREILDPNGGTEPFLAGDHRPIFFRLQRPT